MDILKLFPTKDVYIAQAAPTINFESHNCLFVNRFTSSNDSYRFLMQFNLSIIKESLWAHREITSVKLLMNIFRNEVPSPPGSSNLYIYRLLETFDPMTVTWDNQPKYFDELATIFPVSFAKLGKIEIDVTQLVKDWIYEKFENCGIVIRGEEVYNSLVGFTNTRLEDQSGWPTLLIEFECMDKKENGTLKFNEFYASKSSRYCYYTHCNLVTESQLIGETIFKNNYKGIVVYPSAVNWEPVQRPQQMLKELAKRGYLCIFCDPPSNDFSIKELEPNLFVLNNETYLLPVIKHRFVIVMCTWLIQMAWADFVPNKFVWYDILDRPDFFSCYDEGYEVRHAEMLQEASLVTYSAKLLAEFSTGRSDAIYLPNATTLDDFSFTENGVPTALQGIISTKRPIIGYFGAIEEWFDVDLIAQLAVAHPEWQFVILGRINSFIQQELAFNNIYFLGSIPHNNLAEFAKYFNVGIIPFKITPLTDSVSPVKFFEYASLGKPVVSTPMKEMTQYQCEWVKIAGDYISFEKAIIDCLTPNIQSIAAQKGIIFAMSNQWSSRADVIENFLSHSLEGALCYSNINNYGKVAALATTFLDFNGNNFYSGGAERYLWDLYSICNKNGIEMYIYQYGNSCWVRRYKNIDVISLSDGLVDSTLLNNDTFECFNKNFYLDTQSRTLLNIYSPFFTGIPFISSPSVGISHGVAWDSPDRSFVEGTEFWTQNKRYIDSARLCDTMVSVDSNTANWFQTVDYKVGTEMKVIPNYVNRDEFFPRKDYTIPRNKTIIVYPRRLYEPRGLYLVLGILDSILEKYPQVEFHFIGRGFDEDINNVVAKQVQWGERVKMYSLSFSEMPLAYKDADITLIPTLYSEGTSLSCLEAMACGNAIITTRIGGLTDIIINNYNGYIIEPNEKDLKNAIESLLNDKTTLQLFKTRALELSAAFSKQNWESKWTKIINSSIEKSSVDTSIQTASIVGLIEFRLLDMEKTKNSYFPKLITHLLNKFYLVYIKVKNCNSLPKSFGRLQWMSFEDETNAHTDFIFSDDRLGYEKWTSSNILLTNTWLALFNSDPDKYFP